MFKKRLRPKDRDPSKAAAVAPRAVPHAAPSDPAAAPAPPRPAAQPAKPAPLTQPARPAATVAPPPRPATAAQPAQPAARAPGRPLAATTEPSAPGPMLLVGRDIRLSGEITTCEHLVVEGVVEGELSDTANLEIARSGRFRGSAVVESCLVDGAFEGELTVRGVLSLCATGRISGTIRYGEIEIERGGTIAGNFGTHGAPEGTAALRPAPGNGTRPA